MKIITLHLDAELLQLCKALAKQQGITLNQFIVNAITQFVEKQKAKNDRPI